MEDLAFFWTLFASWRVQHATLELHRLDWSFFYLVGSYRLYLRRLSLRHSQSIFFCHPNGPGDNFNYCFGFLFSVYNLCSIRCSGGLGFLHTNTFSNLTLFAVHSFGAKIPES
jgi:hypothetical protein